MATLLRTYFAPREGRSCQVPPDATKSIPFIIRWFLRALLYAEDGYERHTGHRIDETVGLLSSYKAYISQSGFHFQFTWLVQSTSGTIIIRKILLSHLTIMESKRQENAKNTGHLAFSL